MYTFPVQLARDSLPELMGELMKMLSKSSLTYHLKMPRGEVEQRLGYVFEQQLKYLETDDLKAWQDFCAAIIAERVRQNFDYTEIIEINQMMLDLLKEFFQAKLPPYGTIDGKPADRVVRRLTERLNGLHSVGISTATATALKVKREQIAQPKTV